MEKLLQTYSNEPRGEAELHDNAAFAFVSCVHNSKFVLDNSRMREIKIPTNHKEAMQSAEKSIGYVLNGLKLTRLSRWIPMTWCQNRRRCALGEAACLQGGAHLLGVAS